MPSWTALTKTSPPWTEAITETDDAIETVLPDSPVGVLEISNDGVERPPRGPPGRDVGGDYLGGRDPPELPATSEPKLSSGWGPGRVAIVVVVAALLYSVVVVQVVEYVVHHSPATTTTSSTAPALPPNSNPYIIAAPVEEGVVDITTNWGMGTGMLLSSSGVVLTNYHVIEDATSVIAQVDGAGRYYNATVLGYSMSSDVALLQLSDASGLKTVTMGSSSGPSVGQPIIAIGNENGADTPPGPVAGTVTALDQTVVCSDIGLQTETLHQMIEIDAPIVPGDSGGPLVDSAGQVVGMVTANVASTGQGYAIGIDQALLIAYQIEAGK